MLFDLKTTDGPDEPCSDISTSSVDVADSPSQLPESEESQPPNLLKSTPMPKPSCETTSQESQSTPISETTTRDGENLSLLPADFPAQAQATQENGKGSNIPPLPSGERESDVSLSAEPDSVLLNNLKEWSDEDFEQFLEPYKWQDIQQNLASLERQSLARVIKDPDCLLFPTLTSGDRSLNSRPAGQTKCEKWWRDKGLIPNGSQLGTCALASIMGFPSDWFKGLTKYYSKNATTPNLPTRQDASEPDTLLVEPLRQHKQPLPSAESSTSTKLGDRQMKNKPDLTKNLAVNEPTMLSLSQLRRDGGTQPRANINHETVIEYAEDMKNGARFPAVTVFYDGEIYWLADGFHRVEAAFGAGLTEIAAIVKQGTRRDAVLHSVGANAKHGLRRSNGDKRRAVMTLLEDSEWREWSNVALARSCQVSESFVRKIKKESHFAQNEVTTYTTKHGTTAQMNTANIGKGSSSEPLPPLAEEQELTLKSEDKEVQSPSEDKEVTTPTSFEENNHSSNAPTDNAPANIRDLCSEGDRVRIKDHHEFGGQFGIITFIPDRNSAVVEFSPGKRELFPLKDLDLPPSPIKKEIIIQEGLNYKAGSKCKWYVEVEEENYRRLQEYREKVGTVTINAAIGRFLEKENNPKPISSDDICLALTSNLKQLSQERVQFVVNEIAANHPEIICQVAETLRANYLMEKN